MEEKVGFIKGCFYFLTCLVLCIVAVIFIGLIPKILEVSFQVIGSVVKFIADYTIIPLGKIIWSIKPIRGILKIILGFVIFYFTTEPNFIKDGVIRTHGFSSGCYGILFYIISIAIIIDGFYELTGMRIEPSLAIIILIGIIIYLLPGLFWLVYSLIKKINKK